MNLNKCLGCIENVQSYPCPHCGYDPATDLGSEYALPLKTILAGKYLVGKVLGQGGFGITYIGWDLALEHKVAIKEYYPSGQVSRAPGALELSWYTTESSRQAREDGMQMFLKEARKMSKVDRTPNVVRVRDVFQENNTAYIVMDYVEGETLKARLRKTGPLSWEQAERIFLPVLQAMEQVHRAGLIHRDLSPDNIMLTPDGDVWILDLGAAKDLQKNGGVSSMQVAKGGFSPPEQYFQQGLTGPYTDVYALAATMYYALTGKVPVPAIDRMNKDTMNWDALKQIGVPENVAQALREAMSLQYRERPQSMGEFAAQLAKKSSVLKRSIPKPAVITISVMAAVVCLTIGAVGIIGGRKKENIPAISSGNTIAASTPSAPASTPEKSTTDESTQGKTTEATSKETIPEETAAGETTSEVPEKKLNSDMGYSAKDGKLFFHDFTVPEYSYNMDWKDLSTPGHIESAMDARGNTYLYGFHLDGPARGPYWVTIKLNGAYKSFSAVCAPSSVSEDDGSDYYKVISFYCDDEAAPRYETPHIKFNSDPVSINFDITDVQVIRIQYSATKGSNDLAVLYNAKCQ